MQQWYLVLWPFSVVLMQAAFVAFLVVYGILIVTSFYQNPFKNPGRGCEVFILLYITGITFEEILQASSFLCCCYQHMR